MRGRKPEKKDYACIKFEPITRNWAVTSYRDVCFRFSVDFSGDKPLFALADLIAAIYKEPSITLESGLIRLEFDDLENYVFKELYDKYLSKRAIFSADAKGSKRINETNGDRRWYVNGYLARLACLLIERMGESNEIRYRAKGLRKALEGTGFETSIKAQFQVVLEGKLTALKDFGLL